MAAALVTGAWLAMNGGTAASTVVAAMTLVGLSAGGLRDLGQVHAMWAQGRVAQQKVEEFLARPAQLRRALAVDGRGDALRLQVLYAPGRLHAVAGRDANTLGRVDAALAAFDGLVMETTLRPERMARDAGVDHGDGAHRVGRMPVARRLRATAARCQLPHSRCRLRQPIEGSWPTCNGISCHAVDTTSAGACVAVAWRSSGRTGSARSWDGIAEFSLPPARYRPRSGTQVTEPRRPVRLDWRHSFNRSRPPMLSITPAELHQATRQGEVVIVDVRGPAEFRLLRAAGARNLPLGELADPGRLEGLRREGPTYVICKSGARSQTAIRALENLGFSGLYNVVGGTDAWAAAGLPLDGALAGQR